MRLSGTKWGERMRHLNFWGEQMIKGVKFTSIPVDDQKRAVDFYTAKLGFRIVTDQPFTDQQRWIELGVAGAETRVVLFKFDNGLKPGGFMNVVFWSDNVEKTYEEMKGKGVEFMKPPKAEGWGTSAIFKDSEGNQFVLSSK
jgi:predicted enzyme related to lactoylglutathione lyase